MKRLTLLIGLFLASSTVLAQGTQVVSGHPIYNLNSKIGIGTSSPDNKLEVSGGNIAGLAAVIAKGNNHSWSGPATFIDYNIANGYGRIGTYDYSTSSWKNLVVEGGNVGIGTTSPSYKLTVNSSDGKNLRFENDTEIAFMRLEDNGNLNFWSHGDDDIVFTRGTGLGTESLRVTHQGNVGIGTAAPSEKLDVDGTIQTKNYLKSAYNGDLLIGNDAGGYYIGTGFGVNSTLRMVIGSHNEHIALKAGGSERIRVVGSNGNVGIGTTAPSEKLEVVGNAIIDGEIETQKIIVSTTPGSWPDYVFEPGYKTFSLSELEAYIMENKHLPEVPSAKTIEAKGQDVADIQAILLKKIEEMTLQMIEMNKRLEKLEKENKELKEKH